MTHLKDRVGWAVAGAAVATAVGIVAFHGVPVRGHAERVAVMCAPTEQAIIAEVSSAGTLQTVVRCVPDEVLDARVLSAPRAMPAPYGVAAVPAVATRVAPLEPRASTASPSTQTPVEKTGRDWQRRALIIGGSAGAGAGLGVLVGGGKGAIIGAAAGGGGATLYELLKRDR